MIHLNNKMDKYMICSGIIKVDLQKSTIQHLVTQQK